MRTYLRAAALTVAATLLVSAGAAGVSSAAVPAAETPKGGVRKVLILSIPAVSWADVQAARLPHLDRLFAESAIAGMATRSVRQRTVPGDGYAALGAGARAVAAGADGQNMEPGERYGQGTAAEVYQRRTGIPLRGDIGALSISSTIDANDGLPYDAEAGTLGRTLTEHGIGRAVVANADQDELQPAADQLHREAVLGIMDTTGRVPEGQVGVDLVRHDPAAPFGLAMSRPAAERAFTRAWDARERAVVLVEASDVARANAYRGFVTPDQRAAMRLAALHAADKLAGRLLRHVDPARDAVLVVGPYHSSLRREVTLASLRAPGVAPGWLRTGTTRRTGFVQIVDVAPTVLRLLGIDRPEEMEGRPYEISATSMSFADRAHTIAKLNRAAVFRDNNIGKVTAILLVVTLVLAGAALFVFRRRLVGASQVLEVAALAILGFLVATFVAGLLPWSRWSVGLYFVFLFAFAILYALVCHTFGRRHPADALLLGLGGLMTLHLLDALSGARLEFNTVFGYTPTIGIRLAGLGNPGSAQLCASALLFAALLAWRVPAPAGRRIAVAVLVVTAIVVGAPVFGQDFGGLISAAPAYLLLGLLLYDKKVTAKAVALLAAVLVIAGLAVGFADLARPADSRTHVGRFFEKVGDEGVSGFTTVVGRKASLMLATFRNTGWVLLVFGVLAALAWVAWRTDRLRTLTTRVPTLRSALISFAVLAVLGTILNDSGVQVMGMMLTVLVPTLIVLACRELVPEETTPAVSPPGAATAPARSPA
jgi:hypothetical protein